MEMSFLIPCPSSTIAIVSIDRILAFISDARYLPFPEKIEREHDFMDKMSLGNGTERISPAHEIAHLSPMG